MVKRNIHFTKVADKYLFLEVGRRVKHYTERHPDKPLISLSVGDTSLPLTPTATEGLVQQAARMGTPEGYRGYGSTVGEAPLRSQIASVLYHNRIAPEEIFISDGAKCDIGRLQLLFGREVSIGVQDPTYPVYVETGILVGNASITPLPCSAEHDFFPHPADLPPIDILYLCSPHNPTGGVASRQTLENLISWAHSNKSIIVFDTAYAGYIQEPHLPRSIYEIEGAKEVAIEVSSFSKWNGFTGVRVGWTIIPHALRFEDGYPLWDDFHRLMATFFNGASLISQAGALASLSPQGVEEMQQTLAYYVENASLLYGALAKKGYPVYGGVNAPYLWVDFGEQESWTLFQQLLEETGVITTPGVGFGSRGEGFVRFSAFGTRNQIEQAIERIERKWPAHL